MYCRFSARALRALVPAAVASIGFVHMSPGATFNVSWIGPANALYGTASNWSGGVIPSNLFGSYYNVTINRPGGATVAGNVPATILNLTIGAGNMIVPQTDNELTLIGAAGGGPCTILNNGTLNVGQAIPWSRLSLEGTTTALNGVGTTRLLNGVIAGTSTLTNNQLIIGSGSLGNNGLTIVNNSAIKSDGGILSIDPGAGGFTNHGTISAEGGFASLVNGAFDNSDGHIHATNGTIGLAASHVTGGTLSTGASGEISVAQATIANATLNGAGGGRVRVSTNSGTFSNTINNGTIALQNATVGHFQDSITNNGTITLLGSTGNATLNFGSGTSTFAGNGTILLNSGSAGIARITGSGTFANGNKIIGSGAFVGGTLINSGLIRANAFALELSLQTSGPLTSGVNNGTITVDGNSQLVISQGSWFNSGTMLVGSGTMQINANTGAATLENVGTIAVSTGGTLLIDEDRTIQTTNGQFSIGVGGVAYTNGPMNAGPIQLNGTLNQAARLAAGNIDGVGSLNIAAETSVSADRIRISRLNSGGTVTIASNGSDDAVSRLSAAPQFTGEGRLDLNDNALVVDYVAQSPLATIRSQIATGYTGGAWTGAQLTSSAAASNPGFGLGFGEASSIFTSFPAEFSGQTVDSSTLLLKYTRYGDANLDGFVNLGDFNRVAANFGATGVDWTGGDFNYDGVVNLSDFNRLASNFGLAAGAGGPTPDDWSALAAAVPEPGSVIAPACLAVAFCMRRRREST